MREQWQNDAARHRRYAAGQRIAPGDGNREMYGVVSGQVEVYTIASPASAILERTAREGEFFGVREFFTGSGGSAFRAKEDAVLFVIGEDAFDQIISAHPRVAYGLLSSICAPAGSAASSAAPSPAQPAKASPPAPPTQQVSKAAQASKALGGPPSQTMSTGLFPDGHKGYPGVTKPEYAQLVYDKEYKCPFCSKGFKAKKTFESKLISAKPIRYDLREFFSGFDMAWYDIIICPHCYFSALGALFVDTKGFIGLQIEKTMAGVKKLVSLNFDAERDLDFVFAAHYLALLCASAYTNYRQINTRLWANISWLYEDAEDADMERYAAQKAAQANETLFMETQLTPGQEQIVCLATAGMLYRAGDTKDIRKWVYNVRSNKNGKKLYADLADDLLAMVRPDGGAV